MDDDVKDAVIELAGFYGMTLGDEYLKQVLGEKKSSTDALSAAAESANKNPAAPFTEPRKSFKTIKDAIAEIKDIKDVEKKICVTPNDPSIVGDIDAKLLNTWATPGDQGKGENNSNPYTLEDLRSKDSKSDLSECPVHVVQVFDASHAPTSANTELVALWLNSIPGLEMSRAVPYLDVRIILPGAGGDNSQYSGPKPMSLGTFLVGDKSNVTGDSSNILNSHFLSDTKAATGEIEDGVTVSSAMANKNIVGAMELFTTPQTMLGDKPTSMSDPFRPFMSFIDFSISLAPAGGIMAIQTAKMNLILHDRTRLKDIIPLVAPKSVGKTQIEVTHGWSHPDNNNLGRVSDASVNNRFAKLINAMRATEVYNVTNSEYTFTDSGEVEIEVSLVLAGGSTATSAEITDGVAQSKEKALDEMFESIRDAMAEIRQTRGKVGKVSFPSYVMSSTNVGGASLVLSKELTKVRNWIAKSKKSKNPDYKALATALGKVYGRNSRTNTIYGYKQSKAKVVSNLLKLMGENVDPFLPRRNIGNVTAKLMRVNKPKLAKAKKQKYISFGKAFSVFVAEAFRHKAEDFSEIQVIFYPMNESSSHAHTLNIAQFPIELADFKKIITAKFDVTKSLTLGAFLNVVNSYFLRDQGSLVYGMNSLFGNRTTNDKKEAQPSRQRAKAFKESDEFNEAKLRALHQAYSPGQEAMATDYTFRPPQITVRYDAAPGHGPADSIEAPILRIHVMDQAAGKAEQLKDVLMAFGGDGTFHKKSRTTDDIKTIDGKDVRTPMHGKTVTENISKLGDAIEEVVPGMYSIKTAPDGTALGFNLKEKIKSMFPTVTYGAANSNMITANLNTVSDSSINTVMMMRQDKSDADNDQGEEGGLPLQIMPTQLSVETYGCPYFSFGQQVFIDFNTNTTADNFYSVTGIDHKFSPGEYTTEVQFFQLDGFGTFRSALKNLKSLKEEMKKAEAAAKSK